MENIRVNHVITIPIMLISDNFIHGKKHILQFYHR